MIDVKSCKLFKFLACKFRKQPRSGLWQLKGINRKYCIHNANICRPILVLGHNKSNKQTKWSSIKPKIVTASTSYFLMGMGLGNPWDWESSNDKGYKRLQDFQKFLKQQKPILTLKQKQWIFSSKSSLNQRSNLEFILLIEQKRQSDRPRS